jgi:hypothetical protein
VRFSLITFFQPIDNSRETPCKGTIYIDLGNARAGYSEALASPILPIQTPILYRLRQMLGPYAIAGIEIGYCARNFENAIIGSGR